MRVTELLYLCEDGTFYPVPGTAFIGVVHHAQHYAAVCRQTIKMLCNGTWVTVAPDSDPDLLNRDYMRAQAGCLDEVGPYPKSVLTEHDQKYDHMMSELALTITSPFAARDRTVAEELGPRAE